jgi:membrane protein DedA with SNARE-associated domain
MTHDFMSELLGQLVTWATEVIYAIGYVGVALLIALEQVFPPIPSEVILPLSGSLAASGRFNLPAAIAAATVGSCLGALMLYSIGRFAGEKKLGPWLDRYGKWLLLSRKDLDNSRTWFSRHGTWAVLVARLIPGMRSIVSVPAGLASMPIGRFLALTAIGSGIWNTALIIAGFLLGRNWDQVKGWIAPFGPIVYVILIAVVGLFIGRRLWTMYGPPSRRQAEDDA